MVISMKRVICGIQTFKATLWLISVAFLMVVFGCGGGGSDGSPSAGGTSFDGNTSLAVIDADNAQEVAAEAYKAGQTGETMNPFTSLQAEPADASGRPLAMDLFQMFEENLIQADITGPSGYGIAAVATESGTLNDDCGGTNTASYSITYDDQTGVFSGRFTYQNFCSESGTFSGIASFSGVVNTQNTGGELFSRFSFTFDDLTSTSDGTTFTMNGEMNYEANGGDPTVTLDMFIENNTSGEMAWIDNYTLVYSGQNVDISGTFYHYEHGRVEIETEQSLVFGVGDDYPSSGVMVFTGADSTRVRIQAVSSSLCRVTADTDGDDDFDDYDSGDIAWTALDD